ncbi:group II intron reverse transcriptase/maturase [Clostridium perfringens]|uniref:Group II intron reverse transcriptase/maturase n=1 Tax=Clostridium perfringens TaxID=1502 RepID=A0AAW9JZV0_CLOPF|nr:group II intron reverse transcriptase/maturase [Clostridium perfringens]MBI5993589.1 group II intron reverse transcriptase/maturase [Clostridium perfringens]MBI6001717.1 group II intron reverse transcriptase/maturase [Clostridium perfringens]MBI6013115.1 group II intron reverse transcriptase/maturase [Clostridium perfringens]MBI6043078.1 group II intron reverse transcriptase/maturase [Clostridium perfringens]MBI6058283.1 group II intron reverse transcriptase/maturase [Clostridium perfringen
MVQKYDLPQTEAQLNKLLDNLYQTSKEKLNNNKKPSFKGLLELISSDVVIIKAIHKIKGNNGSQTPGSDDMVINDILQKNYDEVVDLVKKNLIEYNPRLVRRVWIDKPGKKEKRPLGIPTIVDRIVQECVKIVIEPILEAQFFEHSYGFRPMRDTHMALKRITSIIHLTKYKWVVEGDISKFFDNVNHRILLNKLWSLGIHDKRVLMVIKAMLKAGIMKETRLNDIGTPQGGIISPLLANVYLNSLDKWIAREWENKKTRYPYRKKEKMFERLRKTSNLKPAYFIRYADDWVLITDTKENAIKWRNRIAKYLETNLKLKLSDEKTLITDCTKKSIKFVGFRIKADKCLKPKKGQKNNPNAKKTRVTLITRVFPQEDKFKMKIKAISKEIHKLKKMPNKEKVIHQINVINSQIRGVINYFNPATSITTEVKKYSSQLQILAYRCLRRHGVKLVKTEKLSNLLQVHSNYHQAVPAVNVGNNKNPTYVGITNLSFTKWTEPRSKNQSETPYTSEGREMYAKRTAKKEPLARADEYFNLSMSYRISKGQTNKKYNFEYYMNRGYVINRDKFKCRVCKTKVYPNNTAIHHQSPKLPIEEVNKVSKLATVCDECHKKIHNNIDYSNEKHWKQLLKFRQQLQMTD